DGAAVRSIAAPIELWRGFQHQRGSARPPGADGGAKSGVAAANHLHIELNCQIGHALLLSLLAWKSNRRSARQVHPLRRFSSLMQRPRHAYRSGMPAMNRTACDDVAYAASRGMSVTSRLVL